ncbi:UTP--glucose-1-phosphate uridylyltransferase [Marinicella gelatinilytica]|uniref:UTP--glucose-1-phosphate uridylyltransferase n=1 Tax=Marinicella gelatinilytica TaxID=2996017 RepID=UPI0022608958|nr:UTP--glucose-1-phosphate uridylyltransferase [Marinicella gelatinilytica]MCX7543927.1 UTP--glucose-1-phosphate uridylyltransferase [Marinicella gelatinilytica]
MSSHQDNNHPAKITKAVFPVGGLGTRFLPATKSMPKELMPIIDKPLIQYAVEEALAVGIETLIFVTSASKHAIFDHFDPMPSLKMRFEQQGRMDLVEKVNILSPDIKTVYIPQGEPLGLGHAVLQAQSLIGVNEMFTVLLADDFIEAPQNPLLALIECARVTGQTTLSVEQVPAERISSYGIVSPKQWHQGTAEIDAIVEKPHKDEAPSDFGVIGRYVLPARIFEVLKATPADGKGEIQLTDAIKTLLQQEGVHAVQLDGQRFDCGHHEGFVMANLHVAMKDPQLRTKISNYLNDQG